MNKKLMIVMGSFAGAFLLLSYLGWSLLIKPMNVKIEARIAEKDAVEAKLKEAKSKAAQYDKFRAQAENIRRDLNLISMRLDPDYSVREMRRLQARIYASTELRVSKILSGKREKSKTVGLTAHEEQPVTVEFEGGFHDVGQLLNTLMAGHRLLVLHTLDFKQGTGPDGTGSWAIADRSVRGSMVLNMYLEPMPAGAPK